MKEHSTASPIASMDFESLRLAISSPEEILAWSYGEILKPETINYRTQKPEREGLFDERIFGPTKDYECYCGKYKKIRYKGVICDKCGVEVTRSAVRRERMGHIDLAVPIAHIWYVRGVPSVLSLVLDMSMSDIEKVIYFAGFIILEVSEELRKQTLEQLTKEYQQEISQKKIPDPSKIEAAYKSLKLEIEQIQSKKIISEERYHDLSLKYGQIIRVGIGTEAIYELLKKIDVEEEVKKLRNLSKKIGIASRKKILRRLRILEDMKKANLKPEWLILTRLPVLPPDLRPMVQLDGGRFAASDLNDLYRRVLNRNNRLKRLLGQGAPEVIARNEKRMLQEAVDSLIDNSARKTRAVAAAGGTRKLRSLSDILRGKQGRFRQNLLGKRVDYSGRSVIVIGPELKLNQCGLPKIMALELFKTFVISRLISEGYVHNVKNATRLIEQGTPEVWDILEKITSEYYVLLNRAPTLHRLGIQAFQPVLIEGKAIRVHPLVCYAFNADFDGDQMAVHVPLSSQARGEAANLMRSSLNILKPSSGEPVVSPRLDIVLGCFYLTTTLPKAKGENRIFAHQGEAIYAYQAGLVDLRAKIKVRLASSLLKEFPQGQLTETSVGRILFNELLPEGMPFENAEMNSSRLKNVIAFCFKQFGVEKTVELVDKLKNLGFEYATLSGITISMEDIYTPSQKPQTISEAQLKLDQIEQQYRRGLITESEKSVKTVELWTNAKSEIEQAMIAGFEPNSPVMLMVQSGARGSFAQVVQLGGMKGLVVNPAGEIIELPIISNYKEGLSDLEYFISTHGARKGKSDTSLRTSDAGYLTRRLVDVAQDVVISIEDCETDSGLTIYLKEGEVLGQRFADRISGRIAGEDIKHPKSGKVIVKRGEEITDDKASDIAKVGISEIKVRSVLACQAPWGICRACYGYDLSRGKKVALGEVVGIVAAQAIGEPGTQLTMKTFHLGGVTGEDITSGLPRVEELFEARPPKTAAHLSELDGTVKIIKEKNQTQILVRSSKVKEEEIKILKDHRVIPHDGDFVSPKDPLLVSKDKKIIRAKISGKLTIEKDILKIRTTEHIEKLYPISVTSTILVADGAKVQRGDQLTEGHWDLGRALELKGKEAVQKYIISGVQEIYSSQGQTINDKHIEIIVREMFSMVKIIDEGDTEYLPGQIVDLNKVSRQNDKLKSKGKNQATFEQIVMGITRVSLKTDSFLSAASFQETTSVLIDAAAKGKIDHLKGLKENVIVGKLIPAGSSFEGLPKEHNY